VLHGTHVHKYTLLIVYMSTQEGAHPSASQHHFRPPDLHLVPKDVSACWKVHHAGCGSAGRRLGNRCLQGGCECTAVKRA
jgi:hypothetical protein